MISSKPKLTYFNYPGLGESIRLVLQLGNIDFEDIRVSDDQMLEMQGNNELPTGQLPLLEVEELKLSQSEAILRWAGK